MSRKSFHQRIRNNKTNKIKKRLCDKVSYKGKYLTIKEILSIDIHHLWWMFKEAKCIDLTCDVVFQLDNEMKLQDFEKWVNYNQNVKKNNYRKSLISRVAKANNISANKVRVRN